MEYNCVKLAKKLYYDTYARDLTEEGFEEFVHKIGVIDICLRLELNIVLVKELLSHYDDATEDDFFELMDACRSLKKLDLKQYEIH
jgi:type IV secretory pathway VirB6-like protein